MWITIFFQQLNYEIGVPTLRIKRGSFHEEYDLILSYPLVDNFLGILISQLYFSLFLKIWVRLLLLCAKRKLESITLIKAGIIYSQHWGEAWGYKSG